jgi:hypothetical protein
MMVFKIENKIKFIKWFVINLLIVFGVYNLCSSHEAIVERKSRLLMNYYQKIEYRNRLYCSMSPLILILLAVLLTFTFNENAFQLYFSFGLLAFWMLIFYIL